MTCLRCGSRWEPRVAGRPKSCPTCKSYKWDVAPTYRTEVFEPEVLKEGSGGTTQQKVLRGKKGARAGGVGVAPGSAGSGGGVGYRGADGDIVAGGDAVPEVVTEASGVDPGGGLSADRIYVEDAARECGKTMRDVKRAAAQNMRESGLQEEGGRWSVLRPWWDAKKEVEVWVWA